MKTPLPTCKDEKVAGYYSLIHVFPKYSLRFVIGKNGVLTFCLRLQFIIAINYLTFITHFADDHVRRAGLRTGSKLPKLFANRFIMCFNKIGTD